MEALAHEWKIPGLSTHLGIVVGGRLIGPQIQPRDITAGLYAAGFTEAIVLSTASKVALAESQGYERAYNDNTDSAGVVTSRDVGIMQINIPATDIGTPVEEALYDPTTNFARAFHLFKDRAFQPWVAFISDVYLRDTYLKRANRGLANWLADRDLTSVPTDTLAGSPYVHQLTTPVLDFEYRVSAAAAALTDIKHIAARAALTTAIADIKHSVSVGLAAVKS